VRAGAALGLRGDQGKERVWDWCDAKAELRERFVSDKRD